MEKGEKEDMTDWTSQLLERRLELDRVDRQSLDNIKRTESTKRRNKTTKTARRPKRRKYETISEEWGLGGGGEILDRVLSSGIEGRKKKPSSEPVMFRELGAKGESLEPLEPLEPVEPYVKDIVEKPSALEWDGRRLNILALEWEGQGQGFGGGTFSIPAPPGSSRREDRKV